MTQNLYAVGDIHGQIDMLENALEWIEQDGGPDARIIFLGDYTDRGPDSRAVIERLAKGKAEDRNWVFLKGNHDRMFEWFLETPAPRHDPHLLVGYHWLHERLGGTDTLASYGVVFPDRTRLSDVAIMAHAVVPDHHIEFLRDLQICHQEAGKFFVHAGVRPGVPLHSQIEDDLLWIRDEFLHDTRDHGALIVHGHSPVDAVDRRKNRINLDTGAGYNRPLSAVVFDNDDLFLLSRRGRALI